MSARNGATKPFRHSAKASAYRSETAKFREGLNELTFRFSSIRPSIGSMTRAAGSLHEQDRSGTRLFTGEQLDQLEPNQQARLPRRCCLSSARLPAAKLNPQTPNARAPGSGTATRVSSGRAETVPKLGEWER